LRTHLRNYIIQPKLYRYTLVDDDLHTSGRGGSIILFRNTNDVKKNEKNGKIVKVRINAWYTRLSCAVVGGSACGIV